MFIPYLTIENFGGITAYTARLDQEVNLLDSRFPEEIGAALGFLLCNRTSSGIPSHWLGQETRLSAEICLGEETYTLWGKPVRGRLRLFAADSAGADVTARFRHTITHCAEQDSVETFDGRDRTVHLRLRQYRDGDIDLSQRTWRLAETKTFHRQLYRYIRDFQPEPIHSEKNYQLVMSREGIFLPRSPGLSRKPHLSETEEKLFQYLSFLNIAEFWAEVEQLRDLHHRKKPLIIQNFLEFLDESTDIGGLLARTKKLHRQIIILTCPMEDEIKQKWIGE